MELNNSGVVGVSHSHIQVLKSHPQGSNFLFLVFASALASFVHKFLLGVHHRMLVLTLTFQGSQSPAIIPKNFHQPSLGHVITSEPIVVAGRYRLKSPLLHH